MGCEWVTGFGIVRFSMNMAVLGLPQNHNRQMPDAGIARLGMPSVAPFYGCGNESVGGKLFVAPV